jgi:carboxymethylenebutenolidase
MKRIFYSIFSLLLILASTPMQGQKSCCPKPSEMQALALNTDFKEAHLAPLPFEYAPAKGSMITFPIEGGKDGNAFYVPSEGPCMKVLLVFHEWWGLNDYIKKEAELWQSKLGDIDVYAIDLYDGQVATTPDEASKLMSSLDPVRAEAIIKGVLKKIGNKKVATIGWCMGGSWSFAGTLLANENAVGCVMYYGFPEKNLSKVKQLKSDVLYIYGTQDKFIKKLDVDAFGKRIEAIGYKFEFKSYNADHAFANPSNPKYNKQAAGDANAEAFKFLQQHLGL